jgi:hypothetical protein
MELKEKLLRHGISVFAYESKSQKQSEYAHIALSCCEVPLDKLEGAVNKIVEVVRG